MAIDADGAPNAYHPQNKGLDYLANAGKPGSWWGLVTDNGKPNGNPVVQGAKDPFPGYYISTTSLQDDTKKRTDPSRYVDSTKIPYLVLPNAAANRLSARLGDFGAVINAKNGRFSPAIFADIGPAGELGEGSIALAEALDIPSSAKRGGSSRDVIYMVFPGSGNGKPRLNDEITAKATALLAAWGGIEKITACLAALRGETLTPTQASWTRTRLRAHEAVQALRGMVDRPGG
jgi:hypothetical protein